MRTYTHRVQGSDVLIFREKEHVATFDAVTEELHFEEDKFEKYKNGINAEVQRYREGGSDDETTATSDDGTTTPETEDTGTSEIETLRAQNMELRVENVELRDKLKTYGARVVERKVPYEPKKGDPPPENDNKFGDLAPDHIAWGKVNMTKADFNAQYKGRIPDSDLL